MSCSDEVTSLVNDLLHRAYWLVARNLNGGDERDVPNHPCEKKCVCRLSCKSLLAQWCSFTTCQIRQTSTCWRVVIWQLLTYIPECRKVAQKWACGNIAIFDFNGRELTPRDTTASCINTSSRKHLKVSVSISHVFCSFEKQIRPTHPQPWPFVATIRCRTFLLQLSRFIIFAFGRGSLNPALAYTLGDRLCVNPFVHLHVLLKCILDAFSSTKRFACEWSICQFVSRGSFWQLQISWSSFTTSAQPNPGRCDERDVPNHPCEKKCVCRLSCKSLLAQWCSFTTCQINIISYIYLISCLISFAKTTRGQHSRSCCVRPGNAVVWRVGNSCLGELSVFRSQNSTTFRFIT